MHMRGCSFVVLLVAVTRFAAVAQTAAPESIARFEHTYFHQNGLSVSCIDIYGDSRYQLVQHFPGLHGVDPPEVRAYESRLSDTDFKALEVLLSSREVINLNSSEWGGVTHQIDEEFLVGNIRRDGATQRFLYTNHPGHPLPKGARLVISWMRPIEKRKPTTRKDIPPTSCGFPVFNQFR